MIISPPFPTNKSQCFGQQAISYSDISEVNEYIKLWGWLNRGEKWQFTAQCAAKQCSTHLQSFFLYYLVCVELFYFFWAHLAELWL